MSKHPIVHIEFSAKDREVAGAFYHDLFGWEIQQMPEINYALFNSGEGSPGGGFNPITEDYPLGTIIVYINTDDINATLRQIEECGGKALTERTEIPGEGWFALFNDPTGNRVALFEPKMKA